MHPIQTLPSAKHREDDKNYSKFRHDFMKTSDHGRSSWRIADALGLKIITSNIEIA
jgi:hypothetical protein